MNIVVECKKKCIHIYLAKYTGVTCMIGPCNCKIVLFLKHNKGNFIRFNLKSLPHSVVSPHYSRQFANFGGWYVSHPQFGSEFLFSGFLYFYVILFWLLLSTKDYWTGWLPIVVLTWWSISWLADYQTLGSSHIEFSVMDPELVH